MKLINKTRIGILIAFVLLTGNLFSQQTTDAGGQDDWEFVVAPYMLLGSVSGDATLGVAGPAEVDLNFGDLLKKLQFAFMIRGEAFKGDWGLITDYFYLRLTDDIAGPQGLVVADLDLRQSIFELFVAKRFRKDWGGFDVFAGIRYWDLGLRVDINAPIDIGIPAAYDENWLDPVVGGRIYYNPSNKFMASLRADFGGFGIGSDFSFNIQPGVGYHLNEWFLLKLQYKYLYANYSNDAELFNFFAYDAAINGPLLGLVFRF